MSESTAAQNKMRDIPTRRIALNDMNQLPNDYSTTPGGTIFSTTPGGTRIVYDRTFLMRCRNSPLTKSPPKNMANIPGVTCPKQGKTEENGEVIREEKEKPEHLDAEQPQFQMDI